MKQNHRKNAPALDINKSLWYVCCCVKGTIIIDCRPIMKALKCKTLGASVMYIVYI